MSSSRTVALTTLLVAITGCAASPAVEAARKPDFVRLSKEIERERKAGELSDGEVEDIADAIAEGEIARAKGSEGEALLPTFGGCARELRSSLKERFEKGDDLGAAAAEVLLSAGVVDDDEYVDFARDADPRPAYRALGARGLFDEDDFGLRRKLYLDLDERVRGAALKAAIKAPTKEDIDALIEAARVDPFPPARAAAARALGRIGGERALIALKDLWLKADPRLREAIVDAFVSPATYEAGGREALVRAAEDPSPGSVAAAVVLARIVIDQEPDRAAREAALGVLVRSIKLGTRGDRTYAMIMAPADPVVIEAIRAAKDDTDPGIALVAHGRLAYIGKPEEQKAARAKLLEIAKGDDPEANRAMAELASLGDKKVVDLLVKELDKESSFARAFAARNLVLMGELPKAARALADKEPYVRSSVACAVIGRD